MCKLTKETVQDNPELALYGMLFDADRTASFTPASIERELLEMDEGEGMRSTLRRCFRNWVDDELLYKSFDGYRVAKLG